MAHSVTNVPEAPRSPKDVKTAKQPLLFCPCRPWGGKAWEAQLQGAGVEVMRGVAGDSFFSS